ncbi:NAD-dependent histone deacetylase sir2 [Dipsacomyces acuminosporus]|nr:NAD-dependent histone deacetylase sir2 [Dipsacomyces acuminosporus]
MAITEVAQADALDLGEELPAAVADAPSPAAKPSIHDRRGGDSDEGGDGGGDNDDDAVGHIDDYMFRFLSESAMAQKSGSNGTNKPSAAVMSDGHAQNESSNREADDAGIKAGTFGKRALGKRGESGLGYEASDDEMSESSKSTKRHRLEHDLPTEGRVYQAAGTRAGSGSNDGDECADDGDELLNVDGSYAPSPLGNLELDAQDVEPFTRFSSEEMDIIRSEAHALGLNAFLQEYVFDKGASVRSLLEVFSEHASLSINMPDLQLLPLLKHHLIRFYRNRPKLPTVNSIEDVVDLIKRSNRIMVLTGAGVSVSCGIPDFRSPTGIYTRLNEEYQLDDPQQMFDIEYFREMPELFYSFAKELYPYNFTPAPSHAFVKLLEDNGKLLRNYTQNIDTLEHVQGIKRVLNCHGSFATATCIKCGYKCDGKELEPDIMAKRIAYCPMCKDGPCEKHKETSSSASSSLGIAALLSGSTLANNTDAGFGDDDHDDDDDDDDDDHDYGVIRGIMKPDITFFGEKLPDEFDQALLVDREKVDLLLVMGSSLKVAPVSDIMGHLPHSVPQIVINKTPILHFNFDVQLLGDADDIVAYLASACGWELRHPRIPGQSTASDEFRASAPVPVESPPAITVPIRAPREDDPAEVDVVQKAYTVPDHWHPFHSAVITGKDLYIASGDARVRLGVDTSDEEDGSYDSASEGGSADALSDSGEGEDDSDGEEREAEQLAEDITSMAHV